MTTPSNANTSGLEVVAWRSTWVGHTGKTCHAYHQDRQEADDNAEHMSGASEPLVTAASAKARIDAAEARADRLADIVKLLDECIWFNPDTQNFEVNHDGSVEKARAALQQETQP